MLTRDEMVDHAFKWIDAWNRRDLDGVLALYAAEATFRSPKAAALMGTPDLNGRAEIEAYWGAALRLIKRLEFRLVETVCDPARQQMAVLYDAYLDRPPVRAVELFQFAGDKVISGEALYGA